MRILDWLGSARRLNDEVNADALRIASLEAALRTGAHFNCLVCGSEFWRKANQIAKGENKFCSRRCSNRRHK